MELSKLVRVLAMVSVYGITFLIEMFACQVTHSLVLLVDSYLNLFILMSLIIMVIGHNLDKQKEVKKNTFGWIRIQVLGSMFNMIFFAALSFSVIVEGIQTLVHIHEDIKPDYPMTLIFFGLIGFTFRVLLYFLIGDFKKEEEFFLTVQGDELMVNFIDKSDPQSKKKSKKDSRKRNDPDKISRNHESEYKSIAKVFCSSLFVVLDGLIIIFGYGTFSEISDSILAIICVFAIHISFYPSMKELGLILMQTVPKNLDVQTIKNNILRKFPSIVNIHDLHVWCLTRTEVIATCHVVLPPQTESSYTEISKNLKDYFKEIGIKFVTIQPEFKADLDNKHPCLYRCSKLCDAKICCNEDNCHDVVCN